MMSEWTTEPAVMGSLMPGMVSIKRAGRQVAMAFAAEADLIVVALSNVKFGALEAQVQQLETERDEAKRVSDTRLLRWDECREWLTSANAQNAALREALTRAGEFHNHRVAYDLESEQWELLVDNRQGDKGHPMLSTYYEDVADLLCAAALKSGSQA